MKARFKRQTQLNRAPLERMAVAWEMIRTGKLPSCSTIAARMEVSPKTVHRDLVFMRDRLRFEFHYDHRRGGYAVAPTQQDCACVFCGGGRKC